MTRIRKLLLAICVALAVAPATFAQPEHFSVKSSAARPELTNLFVHSEGWTGADCAYSIPVTAKRTIWLFGDTWIGKIEKGRRVRSSMINNTIAIQDPTDQLKPIAFFWKTVKGKPQPIFKPGDPNTWFWPGDGVTLNGKLYVFLHSIRRKPGDSSCWGFKDAGDELAQIDNPLDKPTEWKVHVNRLPSQCKWGNAVLSEGEFIYSFGEYPAEAHGGTSHPTVLARLSKTKLENMQTDAWEYWCQSPNSQSGVWTDHPEHPLVLFPDGAPEMTVTRVLGIPGYFATYNAPGMSHDILVRHADYPEGPWSDPQIVYHCPDEAKGRFVYNAKSHPELATKEGELIITYCRNSESLQDNIDHAEIYVPQGVTVMLEPPKSH